MKMKSKLIAAVMTLAMAFTMMPMMGAPAHADDPAPPAICLANGAAPNIKGGQKDNIYFGHYPQSEAGSVEELTEDVDYIKVGDKNYLIEPIKWRALYFPIDSQGNLLPELVLLSDQNLDCKPYHEQYTSITWKDSTIRAWLNAGFKNTAFLSGEQEALNVTEVENKDNPEYNIPGGENTQDQIFLLSIEEATNEKYGFTNNYNDTPTREAKNTAYATGQGALTSDAGNGDWWLRSPGYSVYNAAFVLNYGRLYYNDYTVDDDSIAVRPALNLNLSSALFTSAAVGGKSSNAVGAGSLEAVGTNTTNEWKMTVKDKAHEKFKVEKVTTCDENKNILDIKYSGALEGGNEYISAIIKDEGDNIIYYGKLAYASEEDGSKASVNIEGKMSDGYTLCIFYEQCNDDYKTDFSSPLWEVTLPTELHDWKAATCTEAKTCDGCGMTEGNPLGHSWTVREEDVKWNADSNKKPGDPGYYKEENVKATWKCSRDSSHTMVTQAKTLGGVSGGEATCTQTGSYIYNAVFVLPEEEGGIEAAIHKSETIPATGHKYGAWERFDDKQHQKVCGHDASHIEKENHKWDAGKVTKEATEQAEGVKTYSCTVCKATRTETIPKTEIIAEPSVQDGKKAVPAQISTKGRDALIIGWKDVEGAEGYDIFFAKCNHKKKKWDCKVVKTIEGGKNLNWTQTGLKKGTSYKFYVRPYVMENGVKKYIGKSPMMHAYAGGSSKKYTNAKSVKIRNVKKGRLTLAEGKTFKIKASVKKLKKNKKLMPKSHVPTLRYMTSDSSVATVSKSGKITAKGKGTCYIYVYAHNGVSKSIQVAVK